jgi:hypothetical protein
MVEPTSENPISETDLQIKVVSQLLASYMFIFKLALTFRIKKLFFFTRAYKTVPNIFLLR